MFYFINDNIMVKEDLIGKAEVMQVNVPSERVTGTMHDGPRRDVFRVVYSSYEGVELGSRDCGTLEEAQAELIRLDELEGLVRQLNSEGE